MLLEDLKAGAVVPQEHTKAGWAGLSGAERSEMLALASILLMQPIIPQGQLLSRGAVCPGISAWPI